jgi:2-dehydropantoate 2-reductase
MTSLKSAMSSSSSTHGKRKFSMDASVEAQSASATGSNDDLDLKICVAGVGAIGGAIAARLASTGRNVSVFARGHSLEVLRSNGIRLSDARETVEVTVSAHDRADFGVQDIVFLCVKAGALPDLVAQILPLIGPDTIVIPAVNGVPWWYFQDEGGRFDGINVDAVDPSATLRKNLSTRNLVGSVVYMAVHSLSPGVVEALAPHRIVLGELGNRQSARVELVCSLLSSAGIQAVSSPRIRDDVWTKISANLSSNPISALMDATLAEVYGAKELREIVSTMMREAILVAACYGARINADPEKLFALGSSMGNFKTSMLQDLEVGRALELDSICDAVLELAGHFDIPMPATRLVLSLLRFKMKRLQRPPQPKISNVT